MVFTITAQLRSKGMITSSVVRTVWKQRYTPQKQKIWASFQIPRKLRHSKMNDQSGFNAEQIEKDKYPESKTV
jgi:hypothetical protein